MLRRVLYNEFATIGGASNHGELQKHTTPELVPGTVVPGTLYAVPAGGVVPFPSSVTTATRKMSAVNAYVHRCHVCRTHALTWRKKIQ